MRRWDRKQFGFFILLAGFLLLSVLAITAVARSQADSHQILGEEQGYRQALYARLQTQQRPDGSVLTARSRAGVRLWAGHAPDERRTAHIFFPKGMTPKQVEAFFSRSKVDPYILTVALTPPQGLQILPLDEVTVSRQSGHMAERIDAAVRETLRIAIAKHPTLPADTPYAVVEIGLVASVAELAKLADSRGDFVFSFRPSARVASSIDARRACHQRTGGQCDATIHDVPDSGQTNPMEQAARHALGSLLKSTEPDMIAAALAEAQSGLEAAAKRTPRQRRAAHVILRYPVDGWEVQGLLTPLSLELTQIEASVPASAGHFDSMRFSAQQLDLGGSIEERIDLAWSRARAVSNNSAVAGSNNNVVIRLEVVGTLESLRDLLVSQRVQGVFIDASRVVAQRPDADDPRPERRMRRLPMSAGPSLPTIAEVRPAAPMAAESAQELRRQAVEKPHERRIAVLMLRRDTSPDDVERVLADAGLRFLNHRSAIIVGGAVRPITLSPEVLARQKGTLGEQLYRAALESGDVDEGERIRILKLGIEGDLASLAKLLGDERVFTVMLDQVEL